MSTKTTKTVVSSKKVKCSNNQTKVIVADKAPKLKQKKTQLTKMNVPSLSRDQLGSILDKISKEERMVQYYVRKFGSHPHFSTIYTSDHLSSILNETITRVINAVDAYNQRENKISNEDFNELNKIATDSNYSDDDLVIELPKIRKELDLSTIGNITGYMKMALKWNISKDYKKQTAKKNIGNTHTVSMDVQADSSEENNSAIMIFNLLHENSIDLHDDKQEKDRILRHILLTLRDYDKKTNQRTLQNKKSLSKKKMSRLSYLFLYLINPRYQGKYVLVGQEKFGWTPYIFDKHKSNLLRVLKNNFSKELIELMDITNNAPTSGFKENAKAEKTPNYNLQSCEYAQAFSEKYQGDKVIVSLICQIRFNDYGKVGLIQQTVFSTEVPTKNPTDARDHLISTYANEIASMKNEAEKIRLNAVKEVYKIN